MHGCYGKGQRVGNRTVRNCGQSGRRDSGDVTGLNRQLLFIARYVIVVIDDTLSMCFLLYLLLCMPM